jgi:putative membrane protein insertion efficiency factor
MSWAVLALRRLAVVVIRGYRAALSPLLGPSCRFVPSCSHYGEEAIERFGLLHGGALTLWRILRCHPFSQGGLDQVPPPRPPGHAPAVVAANHRRDR